MRRMGGVAGQAGLFSTGNDLAKFAQALLNGGGGILSAMSVEKMTRPEQPPSAPVLRGFGWDIDSPFRRTVGICYRWAGLGIRDLREHRCGSIRLRGLTLFF